MTSGVSPREELGSRIGDYRIDGELDREDTGVVYLGTHVVLPRQTALKVMHGDVPYDRDVAVQLIREACLLEALAHPAVPRVFECGVLPDRRPWTAFERVAGTSIAALTASAPLPLADLVVALRDVADLLRHAHARGVVHRRLTADAIVRTPRAGCSVSVRHWADAVVRAGVASDDIHALGAVAYRALTGSQPDPRVPAAARCPAAPLELTGLVDDMLDPDPGRRPAAGEVRDRAGWLCDTLEVISLDRARWTPPHGLGDAIPSAVGMDEPSGFTIRIGRSSKPNL